MNYTIEGFGSRRLGGAAPPGGQALGEWLRLLLEETREALGKAFHALPDLAALLLPTTVGGGLAGGLELSLEVSAALREASVLLPQALDLPGRLPYPLLQAFEPIDSHAFHPLPRSSS